MIVDDDVDDLEMFMEAVNEIDPTINCLQAKSGIAGLTMLNSVDQKPDYIFVDMNMPKMNGRQFIDEIRKNRSFDSARLIIYSTSRPDDNAMLGADGFISKPTNQDELCLKISKVIGAAIKSATTHF